MADAWRRRSGERLTGQRCQQIADGALDKLRLVMADIGCESPEEFL